MILCLVHLRSQVHYLSKVFPFMYTRNTFISDIVQFGNVIYLSHYLGWERGGVGKRWEGEVGVQF